MAEIEIHGKCKNNAKILKHNLGEAITSRKKHWEYTVVELFHKIKVEYIINIGPQDNYKHVIDDYL